MKNFVKLLSVVVMVLSIGFASCAGGGEDDIIKDIEGNVVYNVESAEIQIESTTIKDLGEGCMATYNAETKTYTVKLFFTDNPTYSNIEFTFYEVKHEQRMGGKITSFKWSNSAFSKWKSGIINYIEKKGKTVEFSFEQVDMCDENERNYKEVKGEVILSRK
jgi:hypothetical protein